MPTYVGASKLQSSFGFLWGGGGAPWENRLRTGNGKISFSLKHFKTVFFLVCFIKAMQNVYPTAIN